LDRRDELDKATPTLLNAIETGLMLSRRDVGPRLHT